MDFLAFSQSIVSTILGVLRSQPSGTLGLNGEDLKGDHLADGEVYQALVRDYRDCGAPFLIHVESHPPISCCTNPDYSVYLDPVDGSLNRDFAVGDPGISIALAKGPSARFGDIFGGYVQGIHSGDVYYSFEGPCNYRKGGGDTFQPVHCDATVKHLRDAILYYNDGYGDVFARSSFSKAGILPFMVKHRNAFDNTALEIAQMCRGAAHLRVEARSTVVDGVLKGSDHANILPVYALGKAAGLKVSDLDGNSLDDVKIEMDAAQDFICSVSPELHQEALTCIKNNGEMLRDLTLGVCPD